MASDHSLAFAGAVLLLGRYTPRAVPDDVRFLSEVHGRSFRIPRDRAPFRSPRRKGHLAMRKEVPWAW